jgi:PIN domain nuclease of toxin-antitoxin system
MVRQVPLHNQGEPVLLDTCAAIWLMSGAPLTPASRAAIRSARTANYGVYVSPITAWEIGILASKARLHLTLSPEVWFETLLALPGIRLADPADRIIAATARLHGYRVITRDSKLLSYAAKGHIFATAC